MTVLRDSRASAPTTASAVASVMEVKQIKTVNPAPPMMNGAQVAIHGPSTLFVASSRRAIVPISATQTRTKTVRPRRPRAR
jgi:hypothetical protein